jgi:DNA repair protein RecO (recombination protein O)
MSATEAAIDAIVLGSTDVAESSKVIRLLTLGRGLVPVFVGNARASRKRYAGALDPGTRVRASLKKGKGDLSFLESIDIRVPVRRPRDDLRRTAAMWYGCDVCGKLCPEDHENDRLYLLLDAWLDLVEADVGPTLASCLALEGKALTFAGLAPALLRCARCAAPLDDPVVWSAEAGGALHARCGGGGACTVAELAALDVLRRTPLKDTPAIAFAGLSPRRLSEFIEHQLGAILPSRALLEEVAIGRDR